MIVFLNHQVSFKHYFHHQIVLLQRNNIFNDNHYNLHQLLLAITIPPYLLLFCIISTVAGSKEILSYTILGITHNGTD